MGVYTTINDPSAHFQTATYTGNGSNGHAITFDGNSNLQPDWLWGKERSQGGNHNVFDSSRGLSKRLTADQADAENTDSTTVTSFNTDGFTLGSSNNINENGVTTVAWNWKANGGTTSTDTTGASSAAGYNTTVQVNQTAGFSIVQWDAAFDQGNGRYNLGHGLGKIPDFILIKNRESSGNWYVHHPNIDSNDYLRLDLTNATSNTGARYTFYRPDFTTSLFNVDYNNLVTQNEAYVAYVFATIQGYSKFDSYTGNGNTDGPFIYTGFKPAWLLIKRIDGTGYWVMLDNKRNTPNGTGGRLGANASDAEYGSANVDILSNGFKIRGSSSDSDTNQNSSVYIFAAFAESPFVSSTGVPTTAR